MGNRWLVGEGVWKLGGVGGLLKLLVVECRLENAVLLGKLLVVE